MKVSDVMTHQVVTVGPGTPLKDVSRILLERRISGVPVVEGGRVVGVISNKDILFKERDPALMEERGFLSRLFRRREAREEAAKADARTAEEAMGTPAITIRPRAPVAEAATLMLEHGINRLPVVDDGTPFGDAESGRLVGIVTHRDLVRAFARTDDQIAAEIRELVDGEPSIPPGRVTVEVEDGEVRLEGDVEWRVSADRLVDRIRRTPGVVAVDSDLGWREIEPELRGPPRAY